LPTSPILDKIPLGIIIFNEANEIISVNGWGEEFIEKTDSCLLGILHDLAKDTWANNLSIEKIVEFYDSNGLFMWSIKTELVKSSFPQVMVVVQDETVKFQLEQTILKAERLAVVGHLAIGSLVEIRNPLTSARGFCQLIQDNTIIKKDYIDIISTELGQIQDIVEKCTFTSEPIPSRCLDDISNKIWAFIGSKIDSFKIIMVSDAGGNSVLDISEEQINAIISLIESLNWIEESVYILNFATAAGSMSLKLNIESISENERDIFRSSMQNKTINRLNLQNSHINMRIINNQTINIELNLPMISANTGS